MNNIELPEEDYLDEEELEKEERDERCMYEERWWDCTYYEDARWL